MLNFKNTENLKEEYLSKRNILKYVAPYDIFKYYIPDLDIGTIMSSPLRKDNKPSFGIYVSKNNELIYNDFKYGAGDCIKFVSLVESCTYKEAMSIINKVFNIGLIDFNTTEVIKTSKPKISNYVPVKKEKTIIQIRIRDWQEHDKEYWHPLDTTKLTNTYPIEYFWIGGYRTKAHKYAYAYRYGKNIYKIYQPLLTISGGKWWSNIDNTIPWFGHDELPKKGDLLIVTSSNKDALTLRQAGFNSIAPHTEAQIFSKEQYKEYNKRFKKIVILYDNDDTGLLKSKLFSDTYGLDYLVFEEEDTKDPYAYMKKYDLETLKDWIEQYI